MESKLPIHRLALLTGAGFTHNFGGFLADQMWEKILNQPDVYLTDSLRQTILLRENELNFEKLYSLLRKSPGLEYSTFLKALDRTYVQLDEVVRKNAVNSSEGEVDLNQLMDWLLRFIPKQQGSSAFLFTLNQDLFFERMRHRVPPYLPGVPRELQCLNVAQTRDIQKFRLSAENTFGFESLNLIKLHGSCNWISSKEEGAEAIAIGLEKENLIQEEPLLQAYFKIFRDVILSGGIQLWVIGYGFGDKHVNDILVDGIENAHLRICVINPQLPKEFFSRLEQVSCPRGKEIRNGISAYVSNSLKGVFPFNKSQPSQPYMSICQLMETHLRLGNGV
jgi:hypothetical protein